VAISEPSQADTDLAAAVRRLGVEVTIRQIERWREEGLLQGPERRGRGRGRGVVAVYAEGADQHAADIATQLGRQRRLHDAALVVFLHGYPVKERAVRSAFASIFGEIRSRLNPGELEDPWDVASKVSGSLSRNASRSATTTSWKRRLRKSGSDEAISAVAHDLIRFALGDADDDETLSPEVLTAVGLDEVFESLPTGLRERFDNLIRMVSLPALEQTAATASFDKLQQARDSLVAMAALLHGEAELSPAEEWSLAVVGIPIALLAGSLLGVAFSSGIALLKGGEDSLTTTTPE
jgi:hypothetical protein